MIGCWHNVPNGWKHISKSLDTFCAMLTDSDHFRAEPDKKTLPIYL